MRARLLVALPLVLALAACTGRYKPQEAVGGAAGGTRTPAAETGPPADCVDATGGAPTLTVSDFAFDPTCLRVTAGSRLTIDNRDASAHSFTVSGGAIDETLESETAEEIRLDALEPGTYAFNCRFHPPMTGTLVVE